MPLWFEQPGWLLLALTVPAIVLVSYRCLAGLDPWRRILAIILRSLVVVAFAAALARAHLVKRTDRLAVFFVQDRSRSIPDDQRARVEEYIRRSAARAENRDRLGILGFDGEAWLDLPPSGPAGAEIATFGSPVDPDKTDIARALRTALASFPEGFGRRIVLATDMNETTGDVLAEAEAAAANGVAIDILPQRYEYRNEVLFDRFVAPAQAQKETRIPLRMVLRSARPARVRLSIAHNDRPVPLGEDVIELRGGMKPEPFAYEVFLDSSPIHRFTARIEPLDAETDTLVQNNVGSAFTVVEDRGKVLMLTDTGEEAEGLRDHEAFVEALLREKIETEVAAVPGFAVDLLKLQEYSAVILANVSADRFTDEEKRALAAYVREMGGGLVLTGGDRSFGAGGWIGSPIEEISPVLFEVKHRKVIPRGGLVIIMHSCEMPRGNYWGEQVAIAATRAISSLDYIGVIAYSFRTGGESWEVPLQPAGDKKAVIQRIRQMQIGDMPDFDRSLVMAVKGLMGLPDVSQRHIIIISDGDPQAPSPGTLARMKANRITCSTVGIGYGAHVVETTLQQIASATGGRFYRGNNPTALPQIFVKEARVVRRSLIEEQPFRPQVFYALAETMRGFAGTEFPPLRGLVLTTPKPQAIEMPLVRSGAEGHDPLMAHWQYEMGKVLVFTSGQWPKWGPEWVSWSRYGAFWAQALRWVRRQPGSSDFDVVTRLEGDKGRVIVEALNRDASFLNQMTITGTMIPPDMQGRPLRLVQTGPGRYEGTFDVKEHGHHIVTLRYAAPGHESGLIRTGVTLAYSPEYRELSANEALMRRVAERTGGRILTGDAKIDDVFHHARPVIQARQPVWRETVLWLLVPLFLLDVAGRRLASLLAMSIYVEGVILVVLVGLLASARAPWWSYVGAVMAAEAVGWTIRRDYIVAAVRFFTHSVWVLGRVSERSAEALGRLRVARDRVRDEMARRGRGSPAGEPEASPLEPAPDRRARFEAGDEAPRPASDLTEALGGATGAAETPPSGPPRPDDREARAGEHTSRLLRAKRRARRDLDAGKDKRE